VPKDIRSTETVVPQMRDLFVAGEPVYATKVEESASSAAHAHLLGRDPGTIGSRKQAGSVQTRSLIPAALVRNLAHLC